MNVLAFDLGGSGGKLLLGHYDGGLIRLEGIHSFDNGAVSLGGGLYWDIVNIYRQMTTGLQKASAAAKIDSFGIDSFSNDFGLIDAKGELLSQVRCYRDDRTIRHAAYVYDRISPKRLYELTGNQNARFNTLMQLGAMFDADQGYLLEHACKLLFIPDLLINFLTGESVAEYTIASVSQLFSFATGGWSREIFDAFGLQGDLFGTVIMPGSRIGPLLGDVAAELNIGGFEVVSVCEHDTASAYLAAYGKDSAIISSGTWSLMGCELGGSLICDTGFRYNVANEGGYPGYHRLLRNVMGSWIIQEIRAHYKTMGKGYSYSDLEAAAEQAPAFVYLIDVDDDLFFSPGDMPGKIQLYCRREYGSAPETLGGLVRCVYESLAMKYRFTLEILEEMTGKLIPAISIVGGGSRDRFLCRLTAACCGRPVAAGPSDATALGNMMVQLISAGELKDVEQGRQMLAQSYPAVWYEPEDHSLWDEQYLAFREKYLSGAREDFS